MKPHLRLGVVYDFRNTPAMAMSNADLYASIIDQVCWLDRLGLDLVWFTEHHFVEDGYLASWAIPPGLRPERMSPSLERFARDVAPRLRARFGGG